QRVEPAQRLREQFVLARCARVAHRRDNSAALLRDLLVGRTVEPHRELFGAVSGIHKMRMAIDETRRNEAASEVMAHRAVVSPIEFGFMAEPFDAAIAYHDSRVADYLGRVRSRRESGVAPDLQACSSHSSIPCLVSMTPIQRVMNGRSRPKLFAHSIAC